MTNNAFNKLFQRLPRQPESPITQDDMDLARSIQDVTEEVILKLAKTLKQQTQMKHLCMAGGVALNCVANGRILQDGIFDHLWVQPAAGDAGGALGAAYNVWYDHLRKSTRNKTPQDQMRGAYLGPEFSDNEIEKCLDEYKAPSLSVEDEALLPQVAKLISQGKVVGWFQGRMEYGPRALGNRSILGDPRHPEMQKNMNLKIKFRESFRPFAPSVLNEKLSEYFETQHESPYMILVAPVHENARLPAVTHVDNSARIQSVCQQVNPKYHRLIKEFEKLTNTPVIVNTSFNVRGEPIVCNPKEAYRCFMHTDIDYLVLGNYLLSKKDQPPFKENYRQKLELD